VIGILPTLRRSDLVVESLSPDERYRVLNEQMLGLRGEPIRLDIAGDDPSGRHDLPPDHLTADFDSIAPEAACTSMQLHLQVHPDSFAGYWNAAQCVAGVQLAVGANSPFLLGARLWAETRSRCSSSPATCAPRNCATRACDPGSGSASGGSPRSWTCSRRTPATSRR
jgi:hypothetical protein